MEKIRALARTLNPLLRTFVVFVVIVMVVYPLVTLAIGQVLFPRQANGSLLACGGKTVGSSLIGYSITSPKLFHPRNQSNTASGVDPHITPEDAYAQIPRITNATAIASSSISHVAQANIDANRGQNLGLLAPDYMDVNNVNLELVLLYPLAYPEFCT